MSIILVPLEIKLHTISMLNLVTYLRAKYSLSACILHSVLEKAIFRVKRTK